MKRILKEIVAELVKNASISSPHIEIKDLSMTLTLC